MRHVLDTVYAISGGLASLSLLGIAVIVFTQVLFNVADFAAAQMIGRSIGLLLPSYAQLAGYALAFATFLSLGLGFRRAAHIRVTLLESRLPRALRRSSLTIISAIGAVLSGLMLWSFAGMTWESWQWGDRASGLIRTPLWIPQSVMLTGLAVLFIATLDTFVEMLRAGRSEALENTGTAETQPEDVHHE